MDKYSVVQEDTCDTVCRGCGRKLVDRSQTNATLCPRCGTKPYEDKYDQRAGQT
jgi:hypothetical protein